MKKYWKSLNFSSLVSWSGVTGNHEYWVFEILWMLRRLWGGEVILKEYVLILTFNSHFEYLCLPVCIIGSYIILYLIIISTNISVDVSLTNQLYIFPLYSPYQPPPPTLPPSSITKTSLSYLERKTNTLVINSSGKRRPKLWKNCRIP